MHQSDSKMTFKRITIMYFSFVMTMNKMSQYNNREKIIYSAFLSYLCVTYGRYKSLLYIFLIFLNQTSLDTLI